MKTRCLAFDFGAGSGRAMLAQSDGHSLTLDEVARFPSTERMGADGLHWDAAMLFAQVDGVLRTVGPVDSVGIDGWGLDYGLLDEGGALIGDPFHYRDARSERGFAASPFDPAWLGAETRAQVLSVNTVFQLLQERRRGARLLMIADLVGHHLTGIAANELTLARTSGMHRWAEGWSDEIAARIGVRPLLGPPVAPGTPLGRTRDGVPVITVAGHDTASAAYALPLQAGEIFLIAGSWNVIGFETRDPPVLPGFGLEGGAEGRALVTRSLDGLRLMRELRARMPDTDYARMAARARDALLAGRNDPVLSIYLGLARQVVDAAAEIGPARALRIGGGGAQDGFFCTLLASLLRIPVIAGPVEASATGNALFQMIGLGRLRDLDAGRALVAASGGLRHYDPDAEMERAARCLPSNVGG